jgi:hypothetical protein
LPFGGNLTDSEILHLGERLKGIIDKAKPIGRMNMSDNARAKWAAIYPICRLPSRASSAP